MKPLRPVLVLLTLSLASIAWAQTVGAPLAPETVQGLGLRARYGVAPPLGDTTIYIDSQAAHYTEDEYISVATRDGAGRWTVRTVGEQRPALLRMDPKKTLDETKALSKAEGLKLDGLLAKPSLYRQRSPSNEPEGVGAVFHTLEIVGRSGHLVIRWNGRLEGQAGQIADLVIGRG